MATYVLIHGAYQGGWIWGPTAARLRAAGHLVYARSLDGCAERRHQLRPGITVATQAAEIAELLFYQDLNDVVLAGTSSGGMVLCRAAELARDRIGRLVFVDALALLDGERVAEIVNRPTPRVTTALAVGPSREDAENRSFADLAPELRAFALARYTPHPIAAMDEPVSLQSFWSQSWPATVIRCRRAANPGEAHQRRTAEKLGAKYLEIDTGHFPMLSDPDVLAPLIMQG
jgi:pimeloyl-ACP methyl ester carboxylesterase